MLNIVTEVFKTELFLYHNVIENKLNYVHI